MMANPCRKEHLGFSKFRSRQQAAKDRRFCITWINRMANKQVEKRIKELRLEFFLMSLDLFKMVDENHQQWLKAMVQVLRESSLHHTTEMKTASWQRQMEEGNSEEDDAEPPGRGKKMSFSTFSDVFADGDTGESETSDVCPDSDISDSETSSSEISDVSPDGDSSDTNTSSSETSSSELSDVSPDVDTSDSQTSDSKTSDSQTSDSKTSGCETSDVSPGGDTNSQPAESDQKENQTGTSQLMTKKAEKISKNPFHQNPGSMTSKGEEERVLMNSANAEEVLLMESEWKEWLDEQQMRGNVKPVNKQNAEEQGGAAPLTPEKETKKKNAKGVGTIKKIKTYLGDLFSPPMYHKWERFEDED